MSRGKFDNSRFLMARLESNSCKKKFNMNQVNLKTSSSYFLTVPSSYICVRHNVTVVKLMNNLLWQLIFCICFYSTSVKVLRVNVHKKKKIDGGKKPFDSSHPSHHVSTV